MSKQIQTSDKSTNQNFDFDLLSQEETFDAIRDTSTKLFESAYGAGNQLTKDFQDHGPVMVKGVSDFIKEHPAESVAIGATSVLSAGLVTGVLVIDSPWVLGACGAGALTATLGNLGGVFQTKSRDLTYDRVKKH
ncbi:MAG: hypothetical protein K8F91_27315 [Candidatus Obscuribacterales bacterium]|nr:hypothetical protein [Candidatus Obscuribacterales bacterium]